MSVVAFDGRMLVADMQMGAYARTLVSKIHKREQGGKTYYIGVTGDAEHAENQIKWFLRNEGAKVVIENPLANIPHYNSEMLVVTIEDRKPTTVRLLKRTGEGVTYHPQQSAIAIGSGFEVAFGAFACGRNAIGAVKAAILVSPSCGLGYEGFDVTTGDHFQVGARVVFDEPVVPPADPEVQVAEEVDEG